IEFNYMPPEEYDYEVEFTMKEGDRNIQEILASAGQSFVWKQGSWFGFDPLDGKLVGPTGPRSEATAAHSKLNLGQRYRTTIEVRKGALRVLLDGDEILNWKGDFKRLGNQ